MTMEARGHAMLDNDNETVCFLIGAQCTKRCGRSDVIGSWSSSLRHRFMEGRTIAAPRQKAFLVRACGVCCFGIICRGTVRHEAREKAV
ncbi:hypothetical protein FH972_024181 [Carpinus fangiana]|uniref:Uncharacterized protein n=1 Tax=Carpinus fangiana TaxID=176857 RepID=A0A5N6KZT0_9ROSI|nr:hypothetical protein FH972_024181 [Carpinus fangiana]